MQRKPISATAANIHKLYAHPDVYNDYVLTTVVCDDGSIFQADDCGSGWQALPPLPGLDGISQTPLITQLCGGINALLGLLQLVSCRHGLPADIREALTVSHRIDEANAALDAALSTDRPKVAL